MCKNRILMGIVLALFMGSIGGAAFGRPPKGMGPPPPMFHLMKLSGICGDETYIYAMSGGKILQYAISEMKLLKAVDLPEPIPPEDAPPEGTEPLEFPPFPPPMAGHGLWAGNGFLYVLAGPVIYRYSTPDLSLQATVELPEPELPEASE